VCPNSNVPLRYVIASATPTRQVSPRHCHHLSDLDLAALVTNFNPVASPNVKDYLHASSSFSHLISRLQDLPPELYVLILSYCQLDLALAVTACKNLYVFMQLVRQDIFRTQFVTCIQAAPLVRPSMLQTIFTEKIVALTEKMKATFVRIAGAEYLQDIVRESSSPEAVDFTIPRCQTQLALLVDDVGILNIAFRANAKGHPDWIRSDVRRHNIVLDTRDFSAIRIVSDVSVDILGQSTGTDLYSLLSVA
jgi:hypothetical protein